MSFDHKQLNGLTLAYMGDAVYEKEIREYLIKKGLTKVNELQRQSKMFVSAKAHAQIFRTLFDQNFFTEAELDIFKRGRNSHPHTKAKNTDIVTYQISSGVEALIGFLYLDGQSERLQEVILKMIKTVEESSKN
ncbi:MAG: Mini-ribonuclease 3 [Lactobacillaceae bacterium]|nr:Mini-ribonuclease 3 [Lactobacillaceae bacterium]